MPNHDTRSCHFCGTHVGFGTVATVTHAGTHVLCAPCATSTDRVVAPRTFVFLPTK